MKAHAREENGMNDQELRTHIARIARGDMAAFDEVYADMKTPVYTVILRTLRDRQLAEDVLQEVFIKLYRQPPTGVRAARAYLFRMARNSALDVLRRQLLVEGDEAFDLVPEDAPPDGGAGLRMDLEAALRCLSVNDRQIVTLHTLGGLRFREIAELMHMPLGTVLWRYRRAIERLRELL
jgi:RNA polymerase sigma-70 factor (ECF subfamily)